MKFKHLKKDKNEGEREKVFCLFCFVYRLINEKESERENEKGFYKRIPVN